MEQDRKEFGYCHCRANTCGCGIPAKIIENLQSQNKQLFETIEQLKAINEQLSHFNSPKIEALEKEKLDLANIVLQLKAENENLKKDVQFLKRLSLFEITEDYSQLKRENEQLKAENGELKKESDKYQGYYISYRNTVDYLQKNNEELLKKYSDSVEKFNDSVDKYLALQDDYDDCYVANKDLYADNRRLGKENAQLKVQLQNCDTASQVNESLAKVWKYQGQINYPIERRPHTCPVCYGVARRVVFDANQFPIANLDCHVCNGTGIVWEAK